MKEQGHTEEEEEREGKRWPGGAGGAARGGDSATQLGLWASFPPGTCLCLSHPLACELLQAQKVSSLSRVQLFVTLRTVAYRLLHPWDFPGKSTGVGCHFLLQGILPTQGLNPGLLHCKQIAYPLSHQGSPRSCLTFLSPNPIASWGGRAEGGGEHESEEPPLGAKPLTGTAHLPRDTSCRRRVSLELPGWTWLPATTGVTSRCSPDSPSN